MKITKFLRQNSRTLLIVFMALLLVTFLIPSTMQGCGENRMRDIVRGRAMGRDVSTRALLRADNDMRVLRLAGFSLPQTASFTLDYYLLTEEAQNAGVRVGRDEVLEALRQRGIADAQLHAIQQETSRSYNEIYDVIARWEAVLRLVGLQMSAAINSVPREELSYRNATQQAVAQVSVLDSRAFLHAVGEPTAEELQAFFAECQDRRTAHTSEKLQFGYRLPDRVQVEYLTVDPEKVKLRIKLKVAQVKQYFDDNPQRYTKAAPPAAQPTQTPQRVPMTFEEAETQVREDLRRERAIEEAQRIVNELYAEVHRPWAAMAKDDAGFTVPPEGGVVSFEELKAKHAASAEIEYAKTELTGAETLQTLKDFGEAALGGGRQPLPAPTLALRVKGILDRDPQDGQPVLNIMEPSPVVMKYEFGARARQSQPYRAFLFRVVAAAPSAPPESMDGIRDQVVQDWKQVKAFELARAAAEQLAAQARASGLTAAVEQAADLKDKLTAAQQAESQPAEAGVSPPNYLQSLQPYTPPTLTRDSFSIGTLGAASEVTQALFDLVDKPQDATTAPAHRIATVPLASQFKWVIGEMVELKPIYAGGFEKKLVQDVQRGVSRELMETFGFYWSSPEKVYQRTGYIAADRPGAPEQ